MNKAQTSSPHCKSCLNGFPTQDSNGQCACPCHIPEEVRRGNESWERIVKNAKIAEAHKDAGHKSEGEKHDPNLFQQKNYLVSQKDVANQPPLAQEEGRVKPHEELFSHRNKKCKCFAPHKESESDWDKGLIELFKKDHQFIKLNTITGNFYVSDGLKSFIGELAERNFHLGVANGRQAERSMILELLEVLKIGSKPEGSMIGVSEFRLVTVEFAQEIYDRIIKAELISKLKSDENSF